MNYLSWLYKKHKETIRLVSIAFGIPMLAVLVLTFLNRDFIFQDSVPLGVIFMMIMYIVSLLVNFVVLVGILALIDSYSKYRKETKDD